MTATIHLVGNLVADAEMSFTTSGTAMLKLRIAVNAPKARDGQTEEPPSYWDVTLWRDDAETCAERLTKGTRVSVTGRPRIREYETRDGGKGRSAEVVWPIVGIIPARERTTQATPPAADPWATAGQPAEEPGW